MSDPPPARPLMGAEFLGATAGDLSRYGSADRIAGLAGVAPVPWDSGNVSGNLHRPGATTAGCNGCSKAGSQQPLFIVIRR
ncbi:transposase [Streptomyces sp. TLI_185]|uniref:transposase n=1 Tax=Streptomyces sp. TLI_185 TaxID=2485151 RepID=UPI0026AB4755